MFEFHSVCRIWQSREPNVMRPRSPLSAEISGHCVLSSETQALLCLVTTTCYQSEEMLILNNSFSRVENSPHSALFYRHCVLGGGAHRHAFIPEGGNKNNPFIQVKIEFITVAFRVSRMCPVPRRPIPIYFKVFFLIYNITIEVTL